MKKKNAIIKKDGIEIETEVVEKKNEQKVEVNFKTSANSILVSVIMIIVGTILFFIPDGVNSIIGYVIGGAFLLAGLLTVIKYFKPGVKASILNLITGILYFAVGIVVVVNPTIVMQLATIIFGIYMLINGILKYYNCYLIKDPSLHLWKLNLISGTIIIVFGLILIINPFANLMLITKISGAFLIIVAVYDIINQLILSKK